MKISPLAIVILLAAALVAGAVALRPGGATQVASPELDAFAKCLAAEEFTMYGAEWCPHCKNEKAHFGTAWQYVPYVECPDNAKLCLEKGVKGYPTWIAKDGRAFAGEQGLEKISRHSGCPLPQGSAQSD